ncbi:MAG: (Fe-S)-binding protein [Firmicutes bacterium]|nr:(Fe-S)-binding protein [Bacillota bacterium]
MMNEERPENDVRQHTLQLFATCLIDLFRPQAAIAAVDVMERHGATVEFPMDQTCCGQFSYNAGYHREAADLARHWVTVFEVALNRDAEAHIIALSGSCAAMIIKEYPALLYRDALDRGDSTAEAERWQERAERVGERVMEFTEWLTQERAADLPTAPGIGVAYHNGCHMRRMLGINTVPEAVLQDHGFSVVPIEDADQCCGFGGTYSMTEWQVSTAIADQKLQAVAKAREMGAQCLTSADFGCLAHLDGRLSRRRDSFPVVYIAELIALRDRGRITIEDLQQMARQKEES